ncbi:endonuclease/exonuclease/phosphatase family protein [Arenibacter sp. GZD96]|uniref:endonuclease/exonuclease/phosphatase family protein n=1 Tax=Aurantibrevibacter litoralis TaxID=3106030 RepID=UPI002AFEE970|nr:endonuclease/exonuclease/phosphatase family protein [Arenibacter sp. GZD-96]MEA1785075.1 endonuclease/exonuclease/phosphatase family protein [Arenibacter sp. GZD-96]
MLHRIILMLNCILVTLLLLACIASYISLNALLVLSLLSLTVPILVFFNMFFVLFWVWQRRRYFLISAVALVMTYLVLGSFYTINFEKSDLENQKELKVLSYNVLGFDRYRRLEEAEVTQKIVHFVREQDPDVVVFQEFNYREAKRFDQYSYHFVNYIFKNESKVQQAIFSKYPIVSQGSLDFPETGNNAIFADIVYQRDTIRIYNVHLQSFKVIPNRASISGEPSEKLLKRILETFRKQREQATLLNEHRKKSPYKSILCGDFNATQFSNVYRILKKDMKDTFLERGAGFGSTYNLRGLPFRIDFILTDSSFEVVAHKNFKIQLSDHFPVMATIRL